MNGEKVSLARGTVISWHDMQSVTIGGLIKEVDDILLNELEDRYGPAIAP